MWLARNGEAARKACINNENWPGVMAALEAKKSAASAEAVSLKKNGFSGGNGLASRKA